MSYRTYVSFPGYDSLRTLQNTTLENTWFFVWGSMDWVCVWVIHLALYILLNDNYIVLIWSSKLTFFV